MRASVRPSLELAPIVLAAVLAGGVLAQPAEPAAAAPAEPPEEITVRGAKTLEQYRVELAAAREDIVKAYNEANSSNRNDIVCRNERPTGTRMPQRVCRSRGQSEAESDAARDFLQSMTRGSGQFRSATGQPGGAQVNSSIGAGAALAGAELVSAESRAAIEAELDSLRRENRQVYRAIVRYLELEDEYKRARGSMPEE